MYRVAVAMRNWHLANRACITSQHADNVLVQKFLEHLGALHFDSALRTNDKAAIPKSRRSVAMLCAASPFDSTFRISVAYLDAHTCPPCPFVDDIPARSS